MKKYIAKEIQELEKENDELLNQINYLSSVEDDLIEPNDNPFEMPMNLKDLIPNNEIEDFDKVILDLKVKYLQNEEKIKSLLSNTKKGKVVSNA